MGRRVYAVRCGVETPAALQEIARNYGCVFMGKGGVLEPSVGLLLDRIARGELEILPKGVDTP